jgi:hypothetical protein
VQWGYNIFGKKGNRYMYSSVDVGGGIVLPDTHEPEPKEEDPPIAHWVPGQNPGIQPIFLSCFIVPPYKNRRI